MTHPNPEDCAFGIRPDSATPDPAPVAPDKAKDKTKDAEVPK